MQYISVVAVVLVVVFIFILFSFYKFMPKRMIFRSLSLQRSFLLQIVVDSHYDIFSSKQQTGQTTQKSQSRLWQKVKSIS